MSRPNIKTFERLEEIQEKIDKLYEAKRKLLTKVIEKYGPNQFVYELEKENEEGKRFVRYELGDQLEAFKTGEPIFKATALERYSFKASYLKNEPKA
jgi:hypothetical protein